MVVSIDTNSGFCFGVTRAITAAESELSKGSLYCLGDIVHNGQEVARLEKLGLQTIDNDDLRTLPSHSRVLLRAHGEPPSTYWIAERKGIEIIDATCPVVRKLQERIRACYELHRTDEALPPQIVIYGKPGQSSACRDRLTTPPSSSSPSINWTVSTSPVLSTSSRKQQRA